MMCALRTVCSSSSSSKISPSHGVRATWRTPRTVHSDSTTSVNMACRFSAVKSRHDVQPWTFAQSGFAVLMLHLARFITTGLGLASSSKMVVFLDMAGRVKVRILFGFSHLKKYLGAVRCSEAGSMEVMWG